MPLPRGTLVTPVGFDNDGYPRALSLLWGYTAHWVEKGSISAAAVGTNYIYSSVVPSGKIGVATVLASRCSSTTVDKIVYMLWDGSNGYAFATYIVDTEYFNYPFTGWIVVPSGWKVRAQFQGCNGGESLYFTVIGFYMEV